MNKLDFALSLIRGPLVKRLTDRTFIASIGTALTALGGAVAVWNTRGVPIGDKVNVTVGAFAASAAVIGAWSHGNQRKDAEVAKAALGGNTPDTLAIGSVGQTAAPPAQNASSGTNASSDNLDEEPQAEEPPRAPAFDARQIAHEAAHAAASEALLQFERKYIKAKS